MTTHRRNSGNKGLSGEYDMGFHGDTFEKVYIENKCCTHSLATLQPNEFGIFDMSGNVEEWCEWFNENNTDTRKGHVTRGGAWQFDEIGCRLSSRTCDLGDVVIKQ